MTETSFPEPRAHSALNNWLADVRRGNSYALPSHYDVVIFSRAGGDARKVALRCEAIDLPGRALNTATDANMYGVAPEIVDGVTFGGTITMTIQASGDLEERVFFEAWQERAWDRGTWNAKYYKDYIEDMEIYILNQQNIRRYGIKLFECYPKEIGPTSLSADSAGDIIKIPITMAYRYWETLDQGRYIPNLVENIIDPVWPVLSAGAARTIDENMPSVISKLGRTRSDDSYL